MCVPENVLGVKFSMPTTFNSIKIYFVFKVLKMTISISIHLEDQVDLHTTTHDADATVATLVPQPVVLDSGGSGDCAFFIWKLVQSLLYDKSYL